MTKTEFEANLDARARLFKALGHPIRLMMINLIKLKPRHGEELAAILNLQPATISHHLAALSGAGLLKAQKDQYYQTFSLVEGVLDKSLAEMVHLPQPGLASEMVADAYQQKVLATFFKRGRLVQIPAQLKKFQIVMEHIAQEFEPGREYTEQEVNKMLVEINEDVASLRRGLIDVGVMERAHGLYWRKQT